MLRKLISYDIKNEGKVLLLFYIIALLFAIISRLLTLFDSEALVLNVLSGVSKGITYALIANIIINTITRCIANFVKKLYKNESYLTHTLPVTKKTIYASKILSSILISFISIFVIFLCLAIMFYSKENIEWLKMSLQMVANTFDSSITGIIIMLFLTFFMQFVVYLLMGYYAIVLGCKSNDKRVLKVFLCAFILYMITQGITLLIVFILGLISNNIMLIFTSSSISIDLIKELLLIILVIYVIYSFVYYYLGSRLLEKGVDVY